MSKPRFSLPAYVKKSTTMSGVPLRVRDKNALRRLAQMLK